jgi:hypothetical protein
MHVHELIPGNDGRPTTQAGVPARAPSAMLRCTGAAKPISAVTKSSIWWMGRNIASLAAPGPSWWA